MNEQTINKERAKLPRILFHQTTAENAAAIRKGGFRRDAAKGAGSKGPLRGIFFKETSASLSGAGIGISEIEVELDPDLNILDLTNEQPATFVEVPPGVDWIGVQDFALAGWLERNGQQALAQRYQQAIRRMYRGDSEVLDNIWPEIEKLLTEKGYGGVRYIDHFIEGEQADEPFNSVVVFDPEKVKIIPSD